MPNHIELKRYSVFGMELSHFTVHIITAAPVPVVWSFLTCPLGVHTAAHSVSPVHLLFVCSLWLL